MQVQDQQLRDKALQALSSMSSAQIVSASFTNPGGVTDLVTQLMHQPQQQMQPQPNPLAAAVNNNNTLATYAQQAAAGLVPPAAAASLMPNFGAVQQMNLHMQQLSNQMALALSNPLAGARVAPGVASLPFPGAAAAAGVLHSPNRNHVCHSLHCYRVTLATVSHVSILTCVCVYLWRVFALVACLLCIPAPTCACRCGPN